MPKEDFELVDRVAIKMRDAFANFEGTKDLVPWHSASSREAWRACARAAIQEIKGDA